MVYLMLFSDRPAGGTQQSSQKAAWRYALLFLLMIVAGAALGSFIGDRLPQRIDAAGEERNILLDLLLIFPIMLVLSLISVAFHEAGHVLGGQLVGFRFLLYIVGPLMITRHGNRLVVGFNRSFSLWGGVASSVPEDNRDLRRRMAVTTAGGPVTSLLLGLIGIGMALFSREIISPEDNTARLLVMAFGVISFLIGLLTGIPMRSGGMKSDGARLLSLIQNKAESERWPALSAIVGASMGGIRPRDWLPGWLEIALCFSDGSLDDISARLLAYSHYLDRDEIDQAGNCIEYAVEHSEGYPSAFRPGLFQEAAYFAAWHRQDASAGRAYLEKGQGGISLGNSTRLRADAAVLFAEGQRAAAARAARQGLAVLPRCPDRGSALAEAEWLQAILSAAESQQLDT